jgi:predicted RNA-binding Zn-ribbon protein involved in translation (DUF1610 family)
MRNRTVPQPEHPQVDWSTRTRDGQGRTLVEVTCPVCGEIRMRSAYDVARRIRDGKFDGRCLADSTVGKIRADNTIGRQPHPSVDWSNTTLITVDRQRVNHVHVTCPICGESRWGQVQVIANAIAKGHFTGKCVKCGSNAKKRDWLVLSPGRKIEPAKGYIRLSRHAVPPQDLWLWDGLKRSGSMVLEHRFVMSKVLHRPLLPNELVDHMDGNKLNNDPSNLRLYIRGRNMPGEHSGYGTYYHEWQLALARIKELEEQLSAIT